jgi:DNA-binding transcriptional ArsR family regulator
MSEEAAEPDKAATGWDAVADMRNLTDPRDMRALAHPIRLALLEVLGANGPLTATQAGELIGESPSSCSFHLRTLARHHFVEETGDGRGRQRPWRLVSTGMNISDVRKDSESFVAAAALAQIVAERQLDRLQNWLVRRNEVDQTWLDATSQSDFVGWLTAEELSEINDDVLAVLRRYHDRLSDPSLRPPDSQLVEMLYFSFLPHFGPPDAEPDVDPAEPSA